MGVKLRGCAVFEAKDAGDRGDLKKGMSLRDGLGTEWTRFGNLAYVRFKDKGGFQDNDFGN